MATVIENRKFFNGSQQLYLKPELAKHAPL